MAINAEFGRRARIARARMDDPPTLEEIAKAVGRRLGVPPPSAQAVGKWLAKGQEPDSFDAVRALAEALHCDPAWLAFGLGGTGHSEVSNLDRPQGKTGLKQHPKGAVVKPAEEGAKLRGRSK